MSGAASWDAKRTQPASDAEAYAWECAENMRGWALRAEESNRELREQLDAALVKLEEDLCSPCLRAARAALGVEGEQEPGSP